MAEHQITVALIANPEDPHRRMIPDEEWQRPYRDRRKAQLTVDSLATLAEVMQQAEGAFGIAPPPGYEYPSSLPVHRRIAFYKPADEEAFAPRALPRLHWAQLVLVDDGGRAIFGISDQREISFADLLRAAEAGVVDGDPFRPYLFIEPGWGDAPPPDWPTLLVGLEVAWNVLAGIATVGGAWAFADQIYQRLRDRIGAGKQTVESHREWADRGTRPFQFVSLILTREWKTTELAQLLGCSDPEAEAMLWILGFSKNESNDTWALGGDVEASLIQAIQEQIAITSHRGGQDWEESLRKRIVQLLETGESPPLDER